MGRTGSAKSKRKRRGKIRVGSNVRSAYRAQWYGVVEAIDGDIATVTMTHDCNRAPAKRKSHRLHLDYLEIATAKDGET